MTLDPNNDAQWVADYTSGAFDNVSDTTASTTTSSDGDQGWTDTATGWTDEHLLNLGYKPRLF